MRGPRLEWPDQVKGLGILLVVLGHVWRGLEAAGLLPGGAVFQTLDRLIYAFHMPLFFCLSGLFFHGVLRRGPVDFLRSRWLQILWPLVLWTWIFFAFKALAGSLANHPADWGDFPLLPLPPREQFWFFWALFVIQVLAWGLLHPMARRGGLRGPVLSLPVLALVWVLGLALVFVPLGGTAEYLGGALRNAGHFGLGLLLAPWLLAPRAEKGGWRVALAALAAFVACEALALSWAPDAVRDLGPATGAVLAVILGLRALPVLPWLAPLGQASAAIYVAHVLFSAALRIGLLQGGVTSVVLHLALGLAGGIFGPYLLWRLLQRWKLARIAGLPG